MDSGGLFWGRLQPRLKCCRPAKVLRLLRGEVRSRGPGVKVTATVELESGKRDEKDSAFRSGRTDPNMRENLLTASNTAQEGTAGEMER